MKKYCSVKHFDNPNSLNKKLELISKGRYQNKILLMIAKKQCIFAISLQFNSQLFFSFFYLLGRIYNEQIPEDCITHET